MIIEAQDYPNWSWRIEQWNSKIGWYIYILHHREGRLTLQVGPDGGPHFCFGTANRAMRKADKLCKKKMIREYNRNSKLVL